MHLELRSLVAIEQDLGQGPTLLVDNGAEADVDVGIKGWIIEAQTREGHVDVVVKLRFTPVLDSC